MPIGDGQLRIAADHYINARRAEVVVAGQRFWDALGEPERPEFVRAWHSVDPEVRERYRAALFAASAAEKLARAIAALP